ncbi:hypothetical protein AB0H34_46745 [Saccharopolyspora shandongensis]|uniref:hypothetical protein n=1 Tax=Saccharopolyspora shandongensis TaxID=418495 RepID=UPI00340A84F2
MESSWAPVWRFVRRHHQIIMAVVWLVLTPLTWWALHSFAHYVDTLDWDCGGGSCATNDGLGGAMPLAIVGGIAASVVGGFALGAIAPAITLGGLGVSFLLGLRAAVADGFTPEHTIGVPKGFSIALMVIGGLFLLGAIAGWKGKLDRRRARAAG